MPNIIEVDGLDELEVENTPIDDLDLANVNLMFLGIDQSSSMDIYVDDMIDGLRIFKESISESKESDKMLISRADFSGVIRFRGYKKIDQFDEDYVASGTTRLYDVILEGADRLILYLDLLRQQGIRSKAVFAIFSDGEDMNSVNSFDKAREVINKLNRMEIVTAFITFGAGEREAKDLDFKNILEVGRSASELRKCLGLLSKSLISQSKSAIPKTDDFFEL